MNPFQVYAEVPTMAVETGYKMQTTFWGDFRVCFFDKEAIKDTYKRAFAEWKDDKVYGTELALVLNWLSWFYYEKDNDVAKLYSDLYYEVREYVLDNWKDEKLSYYLETTD